MEQIIKKLQEEIYFSLNKKDWSLQTMADFCGVSRGELGNLLNRGQKDIKLSTLIKISTGLEKPLATLVGNEAK